MNHAGVSSRWSRRTCGSGCTRTRKSLEEGGGAKTEVTVRGLTKTGYLLATDAAGARFELHPDGNSFDFFQGLVKKKLP